MIDISRRRCHDVELILVIALVFSKAQLQTYGVVLDIDDIVHSKLEAFEGRVKLFDGV